MDGAAVQTRLCDPNCTLASKQSLYRYLYCKILYIIYFNMYIYIYYCMALYCITLYYSMLYIYIYIYVFARPACLHEDLELQDPPAQAAGAGDEGVAVALGRFSLLSSIILAYYGDYSYVPVLCGSMY